MSSTSTGLTERGRRLLSWLRRPIGTLLDWFYPRHCYHCEEPLSDPRARWLCPECSAHLVSLRLDGEVCELCGQPLEGAGEPALCLRCRAERRHFDRARSFVGYSGPARSLVRHYKFRGCFYLGPRWLEEMLRRGWLPQDVGQADAVAPIPLHPKRRRQRTYDQAHLLARSLARHLDLPLRSVLIRIRHTSQQAMLPMRRRWDNVRGAFRARRPERTEGRSILLVDDVMTTGTTADECARVLKKAGAAKVQVLTLARTLP